MQRIMIIGCGGAGKSTLARELHRRLGIELIHLDQAYWQAGWIEPATADWKTAVRKLALSEEWIMDGNYGGTMDIRIERADTVIFLDRSRWLCLFRVIRRLIRHYGRTRPDMTEGCPERFSWNFLDYIYRYNQTRRAGILERMKRLRPDQEFVHLRSNRAIRRFLNTASK